MNGRVLYTVRWMKQELVIPSRVPAKRAMRNPRVDNLWTPRIPQTKSSVLLPRCRRRSASARLNCISTPFTEIPRMRAISGFES